MKSIQNKKLPNYIKIDRLVIKGINDLGEEVTIVKLFKPITLKHGDQLNIHWTLDVKK